VLLRVVQRRRRWSRVIPSARDVSAGLSKSVEACMTNLHDRVKKTADWAELHARHGQDVNNHYDEGDQVIVLDATQPTSCVNGGKGQPLLFVPYRLTVIRRSHGSARVL